MPYHDEPDHRGGSDGHWSLVYSSIQTARADTRLWGQAGHHIERRVLIPMRCHLSKYCSFIEDASRRPFIHKNTHQDNVDKFSSLP